MQVPAPFEYERAGSVDDAVALLERHGEDARLIAGGHSLLRLMKLRLAEPQVLIDINGVTDLQAIIVDDDTLRIGSMVRHAELLASAVVGEPCVFRYGTRPSSSGDRANPSRPVLNASFEHSPHHGATSALAPFHSLRSEYSDHDRVGVGSSANRYACNIKACPARSPRPLVPRDSRQPPPIQARAQ